MTLSKRNIVAIGFIFASAICAFAEIRISPFGVLDTDEPSVRVDYNVETENGLETRSKVFSSDIAKSEEKLAAVMKKVKAVKYVFSPDAVPPNVEKRTMFACMKGEAKATKAQLRVRYHRRAHSLIQVETRKFYKAKIPKAVAPMGQFINATGASMILTDKNKKPLGTLLISYSVDTVPPPRTQAEKDRVFGDANVPLIDDAEFFIVSKIPESWTYKERDIYQLPSGELVLVKSVGKFYRCYAFVLRVEAVFTFTKISKKTKKA